MRKFNGLFSIIGVTVIHLTILFYIPNLFMLWWWHPLTLSAFHSLMMCLWALFLSYLATTFLINLFVLFLRCVISDYMMFLIVVMHLLLFLSIRLLCIVLPIRRIFIVYLILLVGLIISLEGWWVRHFLRGYGLALNLGDLKSFLLKFRH